MQYQATFCDLHELVDEHSRVENQNDYKARGERNLPRALQLGKNIRQENTRKNAVDTCVETLLSTQNKVKSKKTNDGEVGGKNRASALT